MEQNNTSSSNTDSKSSSNSNSGPLSMKLISLEKEFDVVTKMYDEAGKNYAKMLQDSVAIVEEDPCAIYSDNSTGVSQACYDKIWKNAGCTTTGVANASSDWAKSQTRKQLYDDSSLWATLNDTTHNDGCYGTGNDATTASSLKNSNYVAIKGYTFWGSKALSDSTVETEDDCKTACSNNADCTGATYNPNKKLCWVRGGNGEIAPGMEDDYAIVTKLKQQALVMLQLNQKLIQLNKDITAELATLGGSSDSTSNGSTSNEKNSPKDQIASIMKHSDLSIKLQKLKKDQDSIESVMKNMKTTDVEYTNSDMYVKQTYVYYVLTVIVALIFASIVIGNSTFSKIAGVIIVLVISVCIYNIKT